MYCRPKFSQVGCDVLLENLLNEEVFISKKEENYPCPFCDKVFTMRQGRYQHKKHCSNNPNRITGKEKKEWTRTKTLVQELKQLLTSDVVSKMMEEKPKPVQKEEQPVDPKPQKESQLPPETGNIYVLIEREFIKTNEKIYKVGCTNNMRNRLSAYPKGSMVILNRTVMNYRDVERDILNKLLKTEGIKQAKDIGHEYFECDINVLLRVVERVIQECGDITLF